ncbi:MAG: oxidoreductase [Chloroflexota bacterium]|nr:aldo/keto reductase [Caldilinea sp.]GIK71935.1 MAG: oxidoreductase [Chloroflexota bacterium]
MNYRSFGATGIQVSEIGLGAWQLANPDWHLSDRNEAERIVHCSLEVGCNFFDTAPGYGGGVSEEILGKALKPVKREQIVICTKTGYTADGVEDFSTGAIRPILETSLRRLQTDYVDILLLHNPPRALMDGRVATQYAELEALKQEGKIRVYGVSLDWREEMELVMATTQSQAFEVYFNAFYQEMLPAFTVAQQRGIGLIVKVPLDSGWLSGRYRGNHRFDDVRNRWTPEVIARRAALVEKFAQIAPPDRSLAHTALQFCLAQPGVSTVIPGAKSVEQALDNIAAAEKPLPAECVQAIYDLWRNEIASDPLPW